MLLPTRIYSPRLYGQEIVEHYRVFSEAGGFNYRGFGVPESNRSLIPARGQIEAEVALRPGSFMTTISSSSSEAAGFKFQIVSKQTGEGLFSGLVRDDVMGSAPIPGLSNRRLPHLLRSPWAVPGDGLLVVRVVNLATVPADVCLYLAFAEPFGGSIKERAN